MAHLRSQQLHNLFLGGEDSGLESSEECLFTGEQGEAKALISI
jgi:hypothetical protein